MNARLTRVGPTMPRSLTRLLSVLLLSMLCCASVRAQESTSPEARRMLVHISGGIGPYFIFSKEHRDPIFHEEGAREETSRESSSALGGHAALFVGWRVQRGLRLGGHFSFVTLGAIDKPDRRDSAASIFLLGPALGFLPFQNHGPLLEARMTAGFLLGAGLPPNAYALSPALEVSYVFLVGQLLQLGVGVDLSAIYAYSASDGDFNSYRNTDWVLSPSLVFKMGL